MYVVLNQNCCLLSLSIFLQLHGVYGSLSPGASNTCNSCTYTVYSTYFMETFLQKNMVMYKLFTLIYPYVMSPTATTSFIICSKLRQVSHQLLLYGPRFLVLVTLMLMLKAFYCDFFSFTNSHEISVT